MTNRSHYLPRASVLKKLSANDKNAILDYHLHQTEGEISGIRSGYISTEGGKARGLKRARARLGRINALFES